MNKEDIYNYLKENDIKYDVDEHKAVYNMEELKDIVLKYPECDAKNIFVRDDKKRNYYLITIKGDKKVNLKEFEKKCDTRRLSFASENDLMNILGLIPGAVTPLGLLNDRELKVEFYLDSYFIDKLIGVHPNDNTATVWMSSSNLIKIIKNSITVTIVIFGYSFCMNAITDINITNSNIGSIFLLSIILKFFISGITQIISTIVEHIYNQFTANPVA